MKLGERLIQNNLITIEHLNEALAIQQSQPELKIGEILIQLGFLTPEALQKALEIE